MKKTKQIVGTILGMSLLIYACVPDAPEEESEVKTEKANQLDRIPPMNLIVLLDLSNRIDTSRNPDQAAKDQMVIESMLKVFGERQKQFGYMISKDKLSIVCANQANPAYEKAAFFEGLSIDMEDHMNRPRYDERKKKLTDKCGQLYEQAIRKADSGADIYTWFKDQFPGYLRKGEYVNKLIILTDGYLAFDSDVARKKQKGTQINWSDFRQLRSHPDNWQEIYVKKEMGFKPHSIDYYNTEVLFMEVQPRKAEINTHELDLLKHFWKDWLNKMNIKGEVQASFSDKNQLIYKLQNFIGNEL